MIHAYNEQFLSTAQEKLAAMFELGVLKENVEINDFANRFLTSPVCRAFERADPILVLGKSANELVGVILGKEPLDIEVSSYASPEYWVGYVLAYVQWYLNKPFSVLLKALPCDKLLNNYFPYHEMDLSHSVDLFLSRLPVHCPLKELRTNRKLSQMQLSLLSNIPVRTIKAYEQGSIDIAKAQAATLYALAQTLGCTIEDLIC